MRYCFILLIFFISTQNIFANSDSTVHYDLPDSVKAVSFIVDINIRSAVAKKEVYAGIKTADVSLVFETDKKKKEIEFSFPSSAAVIAKGIDVDKESDGLEWEYDWQFNITYKLLIASAADSAGNFTLYSGYVFLPEISKWKLVGTCKLHKWTSIKSPASFFSNNKKGVIDPLINNVWVQRSNGSWKKISADDVAVRPSISPMPNADSVQQYEKEVKLLRKAIADGKTDVTKDTAGIFYKIIDAGNGKPVNVNDTVTVKYQLRIFGTTEIIDQATDKPATFPLNRLIKAWQIAVPLVKTGGKLKIIIPSGFAYSIRTRAPKIPPNSILEFDIEVLETKP